MQIERTGTNKKNEQERITERTKSDAERTEITAGCGRTTREYSLIYLLV